MRIDPFDGAGPLSQHYVPSFQVRPQKSLEKRDWLSYDERRIVVLQEMITICSRKIS
jgi:hypothetical protein